MKRALSSVAARPASWLVSLAVLAACGAGAVSPHPPGTAEHAHPPPGARASNPAATAAPSSPSAAPLPASTSTLARAAPPAPDPPVTLRGGGERAVRGEAGLVTSVEPHATRAGADVLRAGGNAVDAAVAAAFALAVTHPSAGNLGGGGFMIVRLASGETHAIDFRESSPAAAEAEQNLANVRAGAIGYPSAGVPGSVAGLSLAAERFGTRPLAALVAPAVALARRGHRFGARQAEVLGWSWPKLSRDPAARALYGHKGKPLRQGELWKQPDLARTLEAIGHEGPRAFYEGPVADRFDAAMRKNGGHIRAADMKGYRAKLREPLRFSYRGFDVATMPPPSMGGVAFAEIMLMLERVGAHEAPVDSGASLHFFIECARRAYSERRILGADPDFLGPGAQEALAQLLAGSYPSVRPPPVDPDRATPSSEIAPSLTVASLESPETTHLSVVDRLGNAVSLTTTQSASYGAKIVIPGTGVLLGNALGAFSPSGPNALEPGKRMSSSMTPTVVSRGGKLALVLGSPGGDTIPNTVAQVMRNLVDWGMSIDQAVAHGRLHHQYLPDTVRVERSAPPPRAALEELERRGHTLRLDPMPIGDANNILVDASGVAWGVADAREGGKAEGVSSVASP